MKKICKVINRLWEPKFNGEIAIHFRHGKMVEASKKEIIFLPDQDATPIASESTCSITKAEGQITFDAEF